MLAAALAASIMILTSCGGSSADESEIVSAAAELVESSYEINNIFFGSGLPSVDVPDEEKSDGLPRYAELAEDSPYQTESEIRAAALAVYSREYCESIFELAFSGAALDVGDSESSVIYARYVDYNGVLTVRLLDDDDEALPLNRTYDTSNITVVRARSDEATVSLPSFVDGVPDDDVSLNLVLTDDGWRLDTPTY